MRGAITLGLSLWLSVVAFSNPPRTAPPAVPNANTNPAGSLANGVLTLSLDARRAVWYPNGDSLPGREVFALAEASGPAIVPGPLVRVPAGTTVELTIRNTLERDTIVFHVPPGRAARQQPPPRTRSRSPPGSAESSASLRPRLVVTSIARGRTIDLPAHSRSADS